ncbi:MAG: nitrilase-related carbon-nitrogen hydrolase [Candidatus Alcyoniella australis]|nr:nitrilase-related carbon-nitrogen hydrolase [Candidatus Alcyoniella australis]
MINENASKSKTVAAIQVGPGPDPQANIERCVELINVAADQGVNLACFPELAHLPWFPAQIDERGFELAQPLDGPAISAIREAAQQRGVAVVFPFFERDGERCYNSTALIDEHGEVRGVYRKLHVPQLPRWEERHYFSAGDNGFVLAQLAGLRVGVQVAWDNLFPEGCRALALAGAELIVAPTANCGESHDLWLRAISANALFNGVYVLRVNRVGGAPEQHFYGRSFLVDPYGDLAGQEAGEAEGLMLGELHREALVLIRREFPLLRDRRPDQYAAICDNQDQEPPE